VNTFLAEHETAFSSMMKLQAGSAEPFNDELATPDYKQKYLDLQKEVQKQQN
jgi:hypothetical protein